MKLLRDVVKGRDRLSRGSYDEDVNSGNAYGRCRECGWYYSENAYLLSRIRHHNICSLYNPHGIEE